MTVDLSISGTAQNTGGAGSDTLANFQGIFGSAFGDTIKAAAYNSYVSGGAGNDTLTGIDGDDTLIGGTGNDTLTGGAGADTFSFTKGDGLDVITDFATGGGDVISLGGYGVNSFSDLQPYITQSGSDTVIAFDAANSISLRNIAPNQLSSANFLFR